MDKVSNSNRQSTPLWERQAQGRGHKSAVDGALRAHRQRTAERQARVQDRLTMVKSIQSQFFPQPALPEPPQIQMNPIQNQPIQQTPINQAPMDAAQLAPDFQLIEEAQSFNPRQIDDIYQEAQLGSSADSAMVLVEKEIANPEEGPVDDMPKGSYIDYTV